MHNLCLCLTGMHVWLLAGLFSVSMTVSTSATSMSSDGPKISTTLSSIPNDLSTYSTPKYMTSVQTQSNDESTLPTPQQVMPVCGEDVRMAMWKTSSLNAIADAQIWMGKVQSIVSCGKVSTLSFYVFCIIVRMNRLNVGNYE